MFTSDIPSWFPALVTPALASPPLEVVVGELVTPNEFVIVGELFTDVELLTVGELLIPTDAADDEEVSPIGVTLTIDVDPAVAELSPAQTGLAHSANITMQKKLRFNFPVSIVSPP